MKQDEVAYIFDHAEVDVIVADEEFLKLLDAFRLQKPNIPIIVDTDVDAVEGELSGPFDDAVQEGLTYDNLTGGRGWEGLDVHPADENSLFGLPYTSGTTSRPKGVECTYRGCYLGTLANVIESGLNFQSKRCRYLWTLPMFHAVGECTRFCSSSTREIDLSWLTILQAGRFHGQLPPSAVLTTVYERSTTP